MTAAISLFFFGWTLFSLPAAAAADEPSSEAASSTETSAAEVPETQPVEPPAPAPEVLAARTEGPSPTGNVTVDFKEADIQNVLRILSFKSGVNIVAGKDVTGVVTIRLVDVPWEKALDVVLKTYGYAYERNDNIIRVTTLENLRKEELSTEVYVLNYALASDVEKSVKDVLSERGKARSDSRSNTLIVTDMPTTLTQISKVIRRLDMATPQVLIEAKVIETALGTADKLGIDWSLRLAVNGPTRPHTFPWAAGERSEFERFLPQGRAPQTENQSVGTSGVTSSSTTTDFPSNSPQPSFPVVDKDEFQFGTVDLSQFGAILELLEKRDDTKILSEPHVMTLNNQEAKILVGEIIAIPTFERNSTTGRMEITGYRDRDLGIRLAVTPQINNENEIVVTINPQITELLGYDELTPDIRAPRFSAREAKTQVRIKNGQTIAIGGLIRETSIEQTSKVPILGNIPFLSRIFGHSDKKVQKTDLLFFMTVNIITDEAPTGHKL